RDRRRGSRPWRGWARRTSRPGRGRARPTGGSAGRPETEAARRSRLPATPKNREQRDAPHAHGAPRLDQLPSRILRRMARSFRAVADGPIVLISSSGRVSGSVTPGHAYVAPASTNVTVIAVIA